MKRTASGEQPREAGIVGRPKSGLVFRSILVVEDEDVLRRVIARNLARRGHVIREAATAAEALMALHADCPDLLLLDINLPDRTGWDVLRELRQCGREVPTVVVSAVQIGPGRIHEFQPLAYLPKPFPMEALLRIAHDGPVHREE
ncbi:MAG: response regulator transcription factor [Chloroflexota bacterium]